MRRRFWSVWTMNQVWIDQTIAYLGHPVVDSSAIRNIVHRWMKSILLLRNEVEEEYWDYQIIEDIPVSQ